MALQVYGAPVHEPQEPGTARLIEHLGDPDPMVREAAELRLRGMGPAVLEALRKASNDPDTERATRAKSIIAEIDFHHRGRIIASRGRRKDLELIQYDPDGGEARGIFRTPRVEDDPAPARFHAFWIPGQKKILVYSEHQTTKADVSWYRAWIVSSVSGKVELAEEPGDPECTYVSSPGAPAPTGSGFAIVMEETDVFSVSLNRSKRERLKTPPGSVFNPAWSADGHKLVFELWDGRWATCVLSPGTGKTEFVVREELRCPAFTASGDSIIGIAESKERRATHLMRMDISTRRISRLASDVGREPPALCPDGKRIAVARWSSEEIVLVDLDGSNERAVAKGECPTWSPDGARLAYERDGRIFVLDIKSRKERELGEGSRPAWSR